MCAVFGVCVFCADAQPSVTQLTICKQVNYILVQENKYQIKKCSKFLLLYKLNKNDDYVSHIHI